MWRDKEVSNPYVAEIDFAYRARRDIEIKSFTHDEPFCIEVGAPIIDLLETIFDPKTAPSPKVEAVGESLRIGPDLLRKGQAITFVVLTDGPVVELSDVNPLANVDAQPEAPYQMRRRVNEAWYQAQGGILKKIVTWAIVLFVVFYIATEPDGAGALVKHVSNGLHDAATSLATFVNRI